MRRCAIPPTWSGRRWRASPRSSSVSRLAIIAGRGLGLQVGAGLRTFAFAVGIYNYGFIPIPLMESLYGREPLGVLLVQNMGCELAVWSVGLFVLAGFAGRDGWRRILNPPICTLIIAVAANLLGVALPAVVTRVIELLGACAIPFGLLLCGVTLDTYVEKPRQLYGGRTTPVACLVRLAVLPAAFLLFAKYAPGFTGAETRDGRAGRHAVRNDAAGPGPTLRRPAADRGADHRRHDAARRAGDSVVAVLWDDVGGNPPNEDSLRTRRGASSIDLRQVRGDLDAVRMMALRLGGAGAFAEQAVELVDQRIE